MESAVVWPDETESTAWRILFRAPGFSTVPTRSSGESRWTEWDRRPFRSWRRIVDIHDDRLEDGIFAFLRAALPARVVGDRFGFW